MSTEDAAINLFRIAKWFRETKQLHGAEAINKSLETITIDLERLAVDRSTLDSKVKELELGLTPEEEFLTISAWMNTYTWMCTCLFIHKLEQEMYPFSTREEYTVPDYLAVYKYKEQLFPVLIEVKATYDAEELEFTASYYERLRNYSQLINLPLLIAWKYKDMGLWLLFELEQMQKKVSAFHINIEDAAKNDLTGILLGNIHIVVKQGTRLVMKIEKTREEILDSSEEGNRHTFIGIIRDSYWVNSEGVRISSDPDNFLLFFSHCVEENTLEFDGNMATLNFFTPEDCGVIGYKLLATALKFPKLEEETQINWMGIVRDQSWPTSYADIVKSAKAGMRTGLIQHIFYIMPAKLPDFLAPLESPLSHLKSLLSSTDE